MSLQSILFGAYTPPAIPASIVHRLGFDELPKYTPPKKPRKKESLDLNPSEKAVLGALVEFNEPTTSMDVATSVNMTRSHSTVVLGALFRKGYISKAPAKRPGGRLFVYWAK